MEIKLKPIGFAKNKEKGHFGGWDEVVTDLVVNDDFKDGLMGLDDYSHLIVIYWLHEIKSCELRHVPQGKIGEVPEVGIFACRCAQRPNPIGISTVKLLSIKKNVVTVKGLDVIDNTPILDIKPYTPQYDAPLGVKVPDWINKLDY
ncbi:tRNA (N6-threonylcarbamoyladenosine(37)-N6)-methyltransferase TrmO [Candidatus Microgenomates bacterium]|nr:tRNA (N6-threonylcarbamoyladenosine(37)-N6)-methyltransferase TrmO [Candidatus Microgenomates bacterium]